MSTSPADAAAGFGTDALAAVIVGGACGCSGAWRDLLLVSSEWGNEGTPCMGPKRSVRFPKPQTLQTLYALNFELVGSEWGNEVPYIIPQRVYIYIYLWGLYSLIPCKPTVRKGWKEEAIAMVCMWGSNFRLWSAAVFWCLMARAHKECGVAFCFVRAEYFHKDGCSSGVALPWDRRGFGFLVVGLLGFQLVFQGDSS